MADSKFGLPNLKIGTQTWNSKFGLPNLKIGQIPSLGTTEIGGADGLGTLDPEIRIPIEEDFVLPPPLESLLDKAKMTYKLLPKQGDIDRLIAKINKKVLRDTICV